MNKIWKLRESVTLLLSANGDEFNLKRNSETIHIKPGATYVKVALKPGDIIEVIKQGSERYDWNSIADEVRGAARTTKEGE